MSHRVLGHVRRLPAVGLACVLLLFVGSPAGSTAPVAHAAGIVVNSLADTVAVDGVCTLREAIRASRTDAPSGDLPGECAAGSGGDTISFAVGGTISLARGELTLDRDLTIAGPGAASLTISGSGTGRVFRVDAGTVTISGVTITGGKANPGGGIYNAGHLVLVDSIVTGNQATTATAGVDWNGGGVFNAWGGALQIERSTISGNTAAYGGGVHNDGTVALVDSTLSGNSATQFGGGLQNWGTAAITNTTFSGNNGAAFGGAIHRSGGSITLADSTITANSSSGPGGGIYLSVDGGVTLKNTIVAGNIAPSSPDIVGVVASEGYNLIGVTQGGAGFAATDLQNVSALLGPLADNGGPTLTHAPLPGSPAVDAGDPAFAPPPDFDQRGPGFPRVMHGRIDVGALEVGDPAQTGPTFTVNSAADPGDGTCTVGDCTLREAIQAANARPNGAAPDRIAFVVPGAGVHTIAPASVLPALTEPASVDGYTQPGAKPGTSQGAGGAVILIELNGDGCPGCQGLTVGPGGSGSTIRGLAIHGGFESAIRIEGGGGSTIAGNSLGLRADGSPHGVRGAGVAVDHSSNNVIGGTGAGAGNTIASNGASGVSIVAGTGNAILSNAIVSNAGLGIDLNADGVTFNHRGDVAGPNDFQNYPVLTLATSDGAGTRVEGTLDAAAGTAFRLEFFDNVTCDPASFGEGQASLGTATVTTDGDGRATFDQTFPRGVPEPHGISATATRLAGDAFGDTSEFSYCRPVATPNLSWLMATPLSPTSTAQQYITDRFQEKWFKFPVQPGSRVRVTYRGLPGSAVSLHRDPNPLYTRLSDPQNPVALAAETPDIAFLPTDSLPSGSMPSGSLPSGSLPLGSQPSQSLPTGFLPSQSLPTGFLQAWSLPSQSLPSQSLPSQSLPSQSLPSGLMPSGSLPPQSLPSQSLPSQSLPSQSLPSQSLPEAYSGAARRSLMAISMVPYATVQTIERDTYDLLEDLYVRVVGPYNLAQPFSLEVTVEGGLCAEVAPIPNGPGAPAVISGPRPDSGRHKTLILTHSGRLAGTPAEVQAALNRLQTLAARPDVDGVVVDLADSSYERVARAYAQADRNPTCPAASNIVVDEIRRVIDAYRAANTDASGQLSLEYIVLAGSRDVIPFYQTPDKAGLANEKEYVPPVKPSTPSEAGLKSGLVQGQDAYGTQTGLLRGDHTFFVPELAVGRLVETAADISAAVDAYVAADGVVTPRSALVTGYDFVADAAQAMKSEIEAGMDSPGCGTSGSCAPIDTLIQPGGEGPGGPNAWHADDLRAKLLGARHDLIVLSGHFSAGNLIAADYDVSRPVNASELESSAVDLTGVLAMTLGCHGGYTIPDADRLEGLSPDPDWAKAFLRKRAAGYISATGYAYGDTELVEYGERLFVDLTQQLRTGQQPVAVGKALVEAKKRYLARTGQLAGIDEKTLVTTTLYGLPMMRVAMPGQRILPPPATSLVVRADPVAAGPGAALGLRIGQPAGGPANGLVDMTPQLAAPATQTLTNLLDGGSVVATYLPGRDGVVAAPFEPLMPRQIDDVGVAGAVLRGVALRAASYADGGPVIPLTAAPTTETSRAHLAFSSDVFYPNQMWLANYFDALAGGSTRLVTVPAQYKSTSPGAVDGTLRTFAGLQFQLYYLDADWPETGSPTVKAAAVAAAPAILGASGVISGNTVKLSATVRGDTSAGMQAVWVLFTAQSGPLYGRWQPLDLSRPDPAGDPDRWEGSLALPAGTDGPDIRFMVEAVNGTGLTTLSTNFGAYYVPGRDGAALQKPTRLALQSTAASGAYLQPAAFGAVLEYSDGSDPAGGWRPLADHAVVLGLGGQQVQATTDANGRASLTLRPVVPPGAYSLDMAFRGDAEFAAAVASGTFTVVKDQTSLALSPQPATGQFGDPAPLTAALRDSSGRGLGGKSVVFVVEGNGHFAARSAIADFNGQASPGVLPLPPGAYAVTAFFGGQIPVGDGQLVTLADDSYEASRATGALTIGPEDATVAYTGETSIPVGATLHLTATVTQAADGFPADLALARVLFRVKTPSGVVAGSVTAPVAADGSSSAMLTGLAANVYRIEASVVGGFFASASPPSSAAVALLTVLDANGGGADGNGWFSSPPGAYPAGPRPPGPARFGFSVDYLRGALSPVGYTIFQLPSVNLNFWSTSLDWLVASGGRAQWKGKGIVNGTGPYSFMVTAIDGHLTGGDGADKMRIKIWDARGVVYDNQMGADDTADPVEPIAAGSITVHP